MNKGYHKCTGHKTKRGKYRSHKFKIFSFELYVTNICLSSLKNYLPGVNLAIRLSNDRLFSITIYHNNYGQYGQQQKQQQRQ